MDCAQPERGKARAEKGHVLGAALCVLSVVFAASREVHVLLPVLRMMNQRHRAVLQFAQGHIQE